MQATKYEASIEAKHSRRLAVEGKTETRIERLETKAGAMIGTLIREGREISYFFPVGGKCKEGSRYEVMAFIIRNGYVR